jgi:site-specific DNA recombinase
MIGGMPEPRDAAWGSSTINDNRARGTDILNNELYLGRLVWNRLRYMKNPDSGKRRSRPSSDDALMIHDAAELRIIGDALRQAVKDPQTQMSLDTRPNSRPPKSLHQQTRPKFVLWGLMRCGSRGARYLKVGRHRFGCVAARNKGAAICANMPTTRRGAFEEIVIRAQDVFEESLAGLRFFPALHRVVAKPVQLLPTML